MTVAALLARPRARPRVGARDPRRHARDPRRPPRRRRRRRDPARDLGRRGCDVKCRRCKAARGHRHPPPQRRVLRRLLPAPLPGAGAPGDRRARHARAGRAGARRGLGRQGLARAVGPPRATSATRPTASTSGSASASTPTSPAATSATFAAGARPARCTRSTCAPTTASTSPARPRPPGARRAARAGSRSATSSTDVALEHGYDVVATGHNLDDEAAVLLGNVLRWEIGYLGRQYPVLPAAPGFARKVKPLVRLGEREMAAYCVLRGIDYQVEECPMAEGNRHLGLQGGAQRSSRTRSPGTKAAFLNGFFAGATSASQTDERRAVELAAVPECGAPTTPGGVCAFCSLRARATGRPPIERAGRAPGRRVAADAPSVRRRRQRAARRPQAAPPPDHPRRGRRVPHPRGRARPRARSSAPTRASRCARPQRAARRGAADARPSTCWRCRAARR